MERGGGHPPRSCLYWMSIGSLRLSAMLSCLAVEERNFEVTFRPIRSRKQFGKYINWEAALLAAEPSGTGRQRQDQTA